ncbi:TRAP transporter substrate-binding protein [Portibacter lacus]|uniref:C4-dicarboxylate ABC transporter n=1 Tax=Portibacter lacus TaxID=1099794 RepID=A0AA37SPL0_9BACT|nr:TRAP transporter substrate-binding protein [Portibacter lacus]GLR16461.1 C4-dicarboxylate ABC transporter [Portibacter lacus]
MSKITRKKFLKSAGILGTMGLAAASCGNIQESKHKNFQEKPDYEWKMVTTWPPNFPVLGEGCNLLADWIYKMSAGRMKITTFGSGELVPGLECFDAVSMGAVEMGHGAGYYWVGKFAASQFFTTVPFGMNTQEFNAWMYGGNGMKLWREVYEQYNLVPMPAGNTGFQMGGWFNKEINSISDLQGLKMRIPGLGGKVLAKAGGTPVVSAGSEIYTNLERGVIDATEWIGPYHDYLMGFHEIAKYYYTPGWHEPQACLELIINKKKFDALPEDLQEIIETAAARSNIWMVSQFVAKNNEYLQKIKAESSVEFKIYPDEVLAALKGYTAEAIEEIIANDADSKKVYEDQLKFRKGVSQWSQISEKMYFDKLI